MTMKHLKWAKNYKLLVLEEHAVPGLKSHENIRAQWKHGHGLLFKIGKHW